VTGGLFSSLLPREITSEAILNIPFSPCGLQVLLALGGIAVVATALPNTQALMVGVCLLS